MRSSCTVFIKEIKLEEEGEKYWIIKCKASSPASQSQWSILEGFGLWGYGFLIVEWKEEEAKVRWSSLMNANGKRVN